MAGSSYLVELLDLNAIKTFAKAVATSQNLSGVTVSAKEVERAILRAITRKDAEDKATQALRLKQAEKDMDEALERAREEREAEEEATKKAVEARAAYDKGVEEARKAEVDRITKAFSPSRILAFWGIAVAIMVGFGLLAIARNPIVESNVTVLTPIVEKCYGEHVSLGFTVRDEVPCDPK
jgi:hypothetical protein